MAVIEAASLLTPSGPTGPGAVEIDGSGVITAIRTGVTGAPDRILCPGFIDMQVNGRGRIDVAEASGDDWDRLDEALLAQGVTSWCPTFVSAPLDQLEDGVGAVAMAAKRPPAPRPSILGVHLEGPFLAVAGAHRPEWLAPVDRGWLDRLPSLVRVVTIAPELPGALDAIGSLSSRGVLIALGHSRASYEEALGAADAGARMVTHLFNAMGPLDHREPGLVGAALSDERLAVSVIADLVHVHPAALRLAAAAKGPSGVVLVTDAVADTGGRPPRTGRAPGAAEPVRLQDGTLAGSTITLDAAVRSLTEQVGIDLAVAVRAASANPARVLGLGDRGELAPGARADLVALAPDMTVEATWVAGELAWAR